MSIWSTWPVGGSWVEGQSSHNTKLKSRHFLQKKDFLYWNGIDSIHIDVQGTGLKTWEWGVPFGESVQHCTTPSSEKNTRRVRKAAETPQCTSGQNQEEEWGLWWGGKGGHLCRSSGFRRQSRTTEVQMKTKGEKLQLTVWRHHVRVRTRGNETNRITIFFFFFFFFTKLLFVQLLVKGNILFISRF